MAVFAIAFGGLLRLSSPIQLAEVASSQSACGDSQCCDSDEDSSVSENISLLCCEHHGDCDCACCHPITSTVQITIDLRRLRDTNQPIDQSIASVSFSPLFAGHSQIVCCAISAPIPKNQSLFKLKSLLIV